MIMSKLLGNPGSHCLQNYVFIDIIEVNAIFLVHAKQG